MSSTRTHPKGGMALSELLNSIEDNLSGRDRLKKLRSIKRDLINEVRSLEDKRNNLRSKRDKKNKQVKDLFAKAREQREKRDAVNEDVKLNKALRDLRKEDADKVLAELEGLEEQLEEMGINPRGRGKRRRINREIQELEMTLQTTGNLPPAEEREIIEKIERLTVKMDKLEVADEKRDELREVQSRLKSLRSEALAHHKEVKKLASQSQEFHEAMVSHIKEARKIRSEADEHHQGVIDYSEKIREVRKNISAVSQETDKVRKDLGEETARERRQRKQKEAQKREAALDDKADDILERYKSGEKLGFEEFKLLISRGLLNEDEN